MKAGHLINCAKNLKATAPENERERERETGCTWNCILVNGSRSPSAMPFAVCCDINVSHVKESFLAFQLLEQKCAEN